MEDHKGSLLSLQCIPGIQLGFVRTRTQKSPVASATGRKTAGITIRAANQPYVDFRSRMPVVSHPSTILSVADLLSPI